ncbi:peroxisomal membrane protein 13 [Spatholobus suberectus]|nr:peroxisomal membrane protein 13 [Spatholobus suberectus]
MNPQDRKRRFNEAIVNILYPSPPRHEQDQLEPLEALIDGSRSHVISGTFDVYDNASTSGNEEHDSETEKLTRAQRKKIRKKKLKEEAIHRGKLIGPLLPLTPTQVAEDAPDVRSNASEEGSANDKHVMSWLVLNQRKGSTGGWQKGRPKKSEMPLLWRTAIKVPLLTSKKLVYKYTHVAFDC